MEEEARVAVIANEALFDELKFNSRVDAFVVAQEELVEGLERKEAAIISGFRNALYAVAGFVVLFGLIIGLWLAVIISKSIAKVRNAAVEIARGNMDVEIDTSGKDEIAELSQAIDKMRESLKAVFEEYEKKVK